MSEKDGVFRVSWFTGYANVDVGSFFGRQRAASVNKLLRIAKQYGTEEERQELLLKMESAIKERDDLRTEMEEFREKFGKKLEPFFIQSPDHPERNKVTLPPTAWETALKKQIDNISKYADIVKAEAWNG